MQVRQPLSSSTELRSGLRTLMFIRVLAVSALLVAGLFIHITDKPSYFGPVKYTHLLLLGSVYLLTLIYIALFKISRAYVLQVYIQLAGDALFATILMMVTGGLYSVFSILFILVIITASILLYRTGGLVLATTCAILYCLVVTLQYCNILKPPATFFPFSSWSSGLYMAFVNVLAFFVVAFLTSYLSELVQRSKTELEAKKEDLHQLESLTDGIITSVSSGIIALDNTGNIVLFNPASEALFGISSKDVTGKRLEEVLPCLSESLNSEDKTTIGNFPTPLTFRDLELEDESGKKIHLRYSLSPLRLSSKGASGSIIVVQDITKIKEIEEEMAKVQGLALLGKLAAAIAHEIRNPMASISGSIQMLKEKMGSDELQSRLIDIALTEVNRLNQMVTDFLVFARPRKPRLKDFDLRILIEETLELFKQSPHWSTKIRLHLDLEGSLPLRSDPQLNKQVFWNLLRNACEAMPSGGELEILAYTAQSQQGEHHSVTLEIKDTGPGMNKEEICKIFTPFFTTKEDGTGLGLAIVKGIVDMLGGEIEGGNNPVRGAWFKVTIPSHPISNKGTTPQSSQ